MRQEAERRPGPGEIGRAVTQHDRVQVDAIFIDQAEFGEAVRQDRASHFDLPVTLGLQGTERAFQIGPDQAGFFGFWERELAPALTGKLAIA